MSRTREEAEHAITMAAAHAWQGHGWQQMYEKFGIFSESQLRVHIAATVWHARTECFIATHEREIYYDRETNTRVILKYRRAGTCLVTRDGPRAFARQYEEETDRLVAAGYDVDSMAPITYGGIRALHPDILEENKFPSYPPNGDRTRQ